MLLLADNWGPGLGTLLLSLALVLLIWGGAALLLLLSPLVGAWVGRRLAAPPRRTAGLVLGLLLGASTDLALLMRWWPGLGAELVLWVAALSFAVAVLPGALLRGRG